MSSNVIITHQFNTFSRTSEQRTLQEQYKFSTCVLSKEVGGFKINSIGKPIIWELEKCPL